MKEEKLVLGEQKCRLAAGSGEEWAWGLWRASQHPGSLRGFNLEWFSWRARPPEPRDPHWPLAALTGTEAAAIHHCHTPLEGKQIRTNRHSHCQPSWVSQHKSEILSETRAYSCFGYHHNYTHRICRFVFLCLWWRGRGRLFERYIQSMHDRNITKLDVSNPPGMWISLEWISTQMSRCFWGKRGTDITRRSR